MSKEIEKQLSDKLDQEYPESWIPENPGDKLIGRFVRVDTGPTSYGPQPIFVLEKGGKEYGVWGLHAVLRSQFAACKPKPGEIVGIAYLGEKQGASNTYKNYKVVKWTEDQAQEVDWAKIAGGIDPTDFAPPEDVPLHQGGTDAMGVVTEEGDLYEPDPWA